MEENFAFLIREVNKLKIIKTRMELGVREAIQKEYNKICDKIQEIEDTPGFNEAKEKEAQTKEEIKNLSKKIVLNYDASFNEEGSICAFEINFSNDVDNIDKEKIINILKQIRGWIYGKEILKYGAKINIEEKKGKYKLLISGRGNDGHCTACRSFRTRLKRELFDLKIGICQRFFCKFDGRGYDDIPSCPN